MVDHKLAGDLHVGGGGPPNRGAVPPVPLHKLTSGASKHSDPHKPITPKSSDLQVPASRISVFT